MRPPQGLGVAIGRICDRTLVFRRSPYKSDGTICNVSDCGVGLVSFLVDQPFCGLNILGPFAQSCLPALRGTLFCALVKRLGFIKISGGQFAGFIDFSASCACSKAACASAWAYRFCNNLASSVSRAACL